MLSSRKAVIYYLFHSGFVVEYGDYLFIFDYYKQPHKTASNGFTENELVDKIAESRYVFAFVSHGHYDHFNPRIFDWKKYNPSLTYILSSDIWSSGLKVDNEGIYFFLSPGDYIKKHDIMVRAYGSTDLGVSFMLNIGEFSIFHAGDLNWWHWADESTEDELKEEERKFKSEVEKIREKNIDIMFFPVDPRLGEHYWIGGAYMLEKFHPRLFVPMHFGGNSYITKQIADRMKYLDIPIIKINYEGQRFEFNF